MRGSHRYNHQREQQPPTHRRHWWCCSLTVPPRSPENSDTVSRQLSKPTEKTKTPSKPASSFPNSPQSHKPSLVGRILSPGRVSPIDSIQESPVVLPPDPSPARSSYAGSLPEDVSHTLEDETLGSSTKESAANLFDVRLTLKGKNGVSLVLELSSEVLSTNSSVFADLIADYRKNATGSSSNLCRIEVPEVEDLNLFRETIELMFEDDITKRLVKIGVYRAIDILEVSAGIMFTKGILSCLKYLEAVPWSEVEEEKLRRLFSKFNFGETSKEILDRLYSLDSRDAQHSLARHLVSSITSCVDGGARNELKPLVKGLLCRSSVYEKDYPDLSKEEIIAICQSCLGSLVSLFENAYGTNPCGEKAKKDTTDKPLIECISKQVDNINWLLEILIDWQIAEDFVDTWAARTELVRMHEMASPMVRYELSRVSAMLFIAMGTRQLHCRSEVREGLIRAWFRPMLMDFGWLQRCRKGLNMKVLEESIGQALLTLPLKQQYMFFIDWFQCISKHGTECPNLSKAFQIWWRRSFLRNSESYAIESR